MGIKHIKLSLQIVNKIDLLEFTKRRNSSNEIKQNGEIHGVF